MAAKSGATLKLKKGNRSVGAVESLFLANIEKWPMQSLNKRGRIREHIQSKALTDKFSAELNHVQQQALYGCRGLGRTADTADAVDYITFCNLANLDRRQQPHFSVPNQRRWMRSARGGRQ
jgi:hypothetical protein